jgi:hypothetical protein
MSLQIKVFVAQATGVPDKPAFGLVGRSYSCLCPRSSAPEIIDTHVAQPPSAVLTFLEASG